MPKKTVSPHKTAKSAPAVKAKKPTVKKPLVTKRKTIKAKKATQAAVPVKKPETTLVPSEIKAKPSANVEATQKPSAVVAPTEAQPRSKEVQGPASLRAKVAVPPPQVVVPLPVRKKKITITPRMTVKDLSLAIGLSIADVIKKLMGLGVWATINQKLDPEVASLIAGDQGFEAVVAKEFVEEQLLQTSESSQDNAKMEPRAPIVTIMGHVDHGKTTLLDAIRETKVVEQESGGITQHIGAYKVKIPKGEIVFLDTPGHEAFTAMRARGAKATDLVVLVVAADDGVMPQTVEAIDHAKAGNVPIIVAINKIDKPEANINRIKQELSNLGLAPEDWGGKTIMVEVSAKRRLNLDKLLEMILLEAEILELKAAPARRALGVILEARKDPKKGNMVTVLVQDGTLKVGDSFVAGLTRGKVRAILDEHGAKLLEAKPATPGVLLGFEDVPQAGDNFIVVANERQAREINERRKLEHEAIYGKGAGKHLTLEDLHKKIETGEVKEFKIILKADVQGSLEAIVGELSKLHHAEVVIKVLHSALGEISIGDVLLAAASDAVILGFHVSSDSQAEEKAKKESVEIRPYSIIYELIGDIRAALEGLLAPIITETTVSALEVRQVFRVSGVGVVAGCYVSQGKIARGGLARVLRGGARVFSGKVTTLKRFKDDVTEVAQSFECGLAISGFTDFRKGDVIEGYIQVKELRKLTSKAS